MTPRLILTLGAASAGIAVAAGAFGAHALRARLEPRMLEVFETAARYQMYHALALLAAGLLLVWAGGGVGAPADGAAPAARIAGPATVAAWGFVLGTVLFSGSLYAMALSGVRALGAITPLGGVGFLVGWGALMVAVGRVR